MIFRRNCLSVGLLDPAEKNVIDGVALPRYVYLDEGRRFLNQKAQKMKPPKSSINT